MSESKIYYVVKTYQSFPYSNNFMFFFKILSTYKSSNNSTINITKQFIDKINLLLLTARSKKKIKTIKIILKLFKTANFPLKFSKSKLQQNLNKEYNKKHVFIPRRDHTKHVNLINQEVIQYIFNINSTYTNTFVNVSDVKGNVKKAFSAGSVDLKTKQKIKKPLAIITIIKQLFNRFKNSRIAIHFKNIAVNHEFLVIKLLKQKFFIKTIRSFNHHPHNGCRPKKLKRLKNRKYQFFRRND